jgi:hypothetical protein
MSAKNFSNLSIGERDLYIQKMKSEIKNKKQLLLDETRSIETIKKSNKLLEGVYSNYKKYYETTVNEKQQQYDAMMLLKEYLDELGKDENMTAHDIKKMKRDQNHIVSEIEKITHELKGMTK